jgi:hypothetical protein
LREKPETEKKDTTMADIGSSCCFSCTWQAPSEQSCHAVPRAAEPQPATNRMSGEVVHQLIPGPTAAGHLIDATLMHCTLGALVLYLIQSIAAP